MSAIRTEFPSGCQDTGRRIKDAVESSGFTVFRTAKNPLELKRVLVGLKGHTLSRLPIYHPALEFDSHQKSCMPKEWLSRIETLDAAFDPWEETLKHLDEKGIPKGLAYGIYGTDGSQLYRECVLYKEEGLKRLQSSFEQLADPSPIIHAAGQRKRIVNELSHDNERSVGLYQR